MNRQDFSHLARQRLLVLDGATGTELILRGMPQGICPEQWIIDNPGALIDVQSKYRTAGSDIVYAPTFGGNRLKLGEFGLADLVNEINRQLVGLSRRAVGDGLVFGDLAPTGQFIQPLGELVFDEVVQVFREQAEALLTGGVNGFVIETMMDIQETMAAVTAVKECCDLPVIVSMTFGQEGRTLTGTDPLTALLTLQATGIDAFGCNCSTGPEDMLEIIRQLKPYATVPLLAKPNAGIPRLEGDKTVFSMGAEEFSRFTPDFIQAGVNIMGGCCGTTPEHIRQLSDKAKGLEVLPARNVAPCAATSSRNTVIFSADNPAAIAGNLIDTSRDSVLKTQLMKGELSRLRELAREQTDLMADIVCIKATASSQNSALVNAACSAGTLLPLLFDLEDTELLGATLRLYPGNAIVRMDAATPERWQTLAQIGNRYGSVFLVTPTYANGPATTIDSIRSSINITLDMLKGLQISPSRVIIDCPCLLPDDKSSIQNLLEAISFCNNELKVAVACDFTEDLPEKRELEYCKNTFLAMAVDRGLNVVLMSPAADLLTSTVFAANALTTRDRKMVRYIKKFSDSKPDASDRDSELSPGELVARYVIRGEEEAICNAVRKALNAKIPPKELVDNYLIPAINKVGDFFDRKEYFLPQLIMSADAMRKAFDIIEPLLLGEQENSGQQAKQKIILATVKGDIHDIGKNIVAIMMRNYNFDVIDLGKDVKPEHILETALSENVKLVGLSALMTTTMTEMKKVVSMARERNMRGLKFMIGGAVVDQNYADEIGAAGYAADAMEAVRLAQRLSEG